MTPVGEPTFFVLCDNHRTPYVVQKVKLIRGQWVPTRRTGLTITELRNDSNQEFWNHIMQAGTPDGDIRIHYEITCGATNCRNKLSADSETLEAILWLILAGIKACDRARLKGAEPSVAAVAYAAPVIAAEDGRVTVTLASLREAIRLRNTLKAPRDDEQSGSTRV